MSIITHNPALFGAAGCGCHQQVYGAIVVGGEEVEPLIFMDFVNGVYTNEGVSTTSDALLTENTDWGPWTPANIQNGVGLVGTGLDDSSPVFTGDAGNLVAAGATVLMEFSGDASADDALKFELVDDLNDYNVNYYSYLGFGTAVCRIGDQNSLDVDEPRLTVGDHKSVVTLLDGKIMRSTDGNMVVEIDPAEPWSDPVAIMGLIVKNHMILHSIGIYPPQLKADHPALSDMGYPTLTAAPIISGTRQVGETISVTTGTWVGAVSYAYQWYSISFATGFEIPGATASTYLIEPAYEGMILRCRIDATNAEGTSTIGVTDTETVIAA